MTKAARATASLPEEIVVWEILVRLPPKPLVRCRSVCRSWSRATRARDFLLAHHGRQPSLPLFSGNDGNIANLRYGNLSGVHYHDMLAFDHRAAADEQLHVVTQLDDAISFQASCDGLLLSKLNKFGCTPCINIYNPATRERASLGLPWDLDILGMYSHQPTGEYRVLLSIHSRDYAMKNIDIWVLRNYESEVWELKYQIKLPVAKIRREFKDSRETWYLNVVSVDGGVLLLVMLDGRLLHVDTDGNLVSSFHRHPCLSMYGCQLKQSLVQHTFFPALAGYAVNASPFVKPVEGVGIYELPS